MKLYDELQNNNLVYVRPSCNKLLCNDDMKQHKDNKSGDIVNIAMCNQITNIRKNVCFYLEIKGGVNKTLCF